MRLRLKMGLSKTLLAPRQLRTRSAPSLPSPATPDSLQTAPMIVSTLVHMRLLLLDAPSHLCRMVSVVPSRLLLDDCQCQARLMPSPRPCSSHNLFTLKKIFVLWSQWEQKCIVCPTTAIVETNNLCFYYSYDKCWRVRIEQENMFPCPLYTGVLNSMQ